MKNNELIAKKLIGRSFFEAPIVAARVDFADSFAHSIAAASASEIAANISTSVQTEKLRQLALSAEIIKNHTETLYVQNLPHILGFTSSADFVRIHQDIWNHCFLIKNYSNRILSAIGGRVTHPISNTVGGFKKLPDKSELREILELGMHFEGIISREIELFSNLFHPDFEVAPNYAAIHHPKEYPLLGEKARTTSGHIFSEHNFADIMKSNKYMTGPLARYNLNHSFLDKLTLKLLRDHNTKTEFTNLFDIVLARAIECHHFWVNTVTLLNHFVETGIKDEHIRPPKKFTSGFAIVESSDGPILHRCELDTRGNITKYEIVTSQDINIFFLDQSLEKFQKQLKESSHKYVEKNRALKLFKNLYRNPNN